MIKTSPRPTLTRTNSKTGAAQHGGTSKLETLRTLLSQPAGATLDEMTTATGWQKHSVRGALAGTLKKKGHVISSETADGVRRYRIQAQA